MSPPRLTKRAGLLGLRPGQAFDLVDGVDLGTVPGRALVWAYLEAHRPRCVVVSSPCTTFSALMAICKGRMPPGKFEQNHGEGKHRLSFAMSVCKFQHSRGRYFLHEHPAGATSWKETSVREVRTLPGAMTSKFDQCCYGLTSPYEGKQYKQTMFLHNIPATRAELGDRYCTCSVRHRPII